MKRCSRGKSSRLFNCGVQCASRPLCKYNVKGAPQRAKALLLGPKFRRCLTCLLNLVPLMARWVLLPSFAVFILYLPESRASPWRARAGSSLHL